MNTFFCILQSAKENKNEKKMNRRKEHENDDDLFIVREDK